MTYEPGQYRLGSSSLERLSTCHPLWQVIIERAIAISPMDFTVACGFRNKADQNEAYALARSTKRFPDSLHNHLSDQEDVAEAHADGVGEPFSLAIDVVPYLDGRARWDLLYELRWLNGFIMGVGMPIAQAAGFYIRTGVDWDMDGSQAEHHFIDAPHLELRRLQGE